jgi:hypothetical protein
VSCARQLRTGLYRSDLGWRTLGDWNQTSSTLGKRAPHGRIGRWSNAFGPDINRLHRQVGQLRIRVVAGFNSEIPSGSISGLSGGLWGLQEGFGQARHLMALAQDSFDRDKVR